MTLTKIDDRGLKTPIDLLDNEKIRLGTSNDLEIYHDSNDSIISDLGAGSLLIRTNGTAVEINKTASEYMARFICDGAVQLYYNNSKKFETTSYGAAVTGGINFSGDSLVQDNVSFFFGAGNDLRISHTGTDSRILNTTAVPLKIMNTGSNGADVHIQARPDEEGIKLLNNSGESKVELYYNNVKQLETQSVGVKVNGHVHATLTGSQISSGDPTAGNYLMLYHDGSNGYIQNGSGGITIKDVSGGNIEIQATDGETSILCNHNGAVELYYDNSKKFETTSSGIDITGKIKATSNIEINADNMELRVGASDDFKISHSSSENINILRSNSPTVFRNEANNETLAKLTPNGSVELYYDNSKKFETFSGGVRVDGELLMQNNSLYLNDNAKLRLGTGQDFNIFHDGTDNIFQSSGLHNFIFKPKDTDVGLKIIGDGGVELYYDNGKKLETTLTGVSITGNTLAVKPVKTIVNTNQGHSSNLRFEISLPNTSRMFKITGTFSFSGNGSGHIYADFGDWTDSHTANLEGVSYQIREGGNSTLEDVGNSRYHKVTASGFDFFNLEVLYEITLTTKAFANGNDTGTQEGGARPGAFGFIKYTHPSIGCALTTFTFQDIAASGTDRLQSFAWDIDGASGSVGNGEHTYVVEEYPLT